MVSNRQQMMSWQIASIILQGFRKHIRGFQSVTTLARQWLLQPLPLSVFALNGKRSSSASRAQR